VDEAIGMIKSVKVSKNMGKKETEKIAQVILKMGKLVSEFQLV